MSPPSDPRSEPARQLPGTSEITLASSPVAGQTRARQLAALPKDELEHLAEEFGLEPWRYRRGGRGGLQELVAAIHQRRQIIAAMDREAMLDVVKWGRRPVTINATKEQI